MKKITKAVIPVAGFGTRFLPFTKAMPKEMLPIVDKPTIQFIVEEAVKSGIKDILIITASHSNKRAIEDHFDRSVTLEFLLKEKHKDKELEMVTEISNMCNIHYIRQKEAKGLGHAILCAKAFVGNEPFAVLLGDDIIVNEKPVTKQLMECYNKTQSTVVGVQEIELENVVKYGIVDCPNKEDLEKITDIIEKPSVEKTPSQKAVLGRYILTPGIFELLETQEIGAGNEIQLTDAIKRLLKKEDVYTYTFEGKRYDIGDKLGFIKATIDFALKHEDVKDEVLQYINSLK